MSADAEVKTTAFEMLAPEMQEVLVVAAKLVAAQNADFDPDTVTKDPAAVHATFELLGASRAARQLVAGRVQVPAGSLAGQLLAAGDGDAGRLAEQARSEFGALVLTARSNRRALNRREAKQPEADRAAERAEGRLNEARESRDRYRAQAERLTGEVDGLRSRVSELEEGQEEMGARLEAAQRHLASLRAQQADPVFLAATLAEVLTGLLEQPVDHPANSTRTDPFAHLEGLTLSPERDTGAGTVADGSGQAGSSGGRRFVRTLLRGLQALATPRPVLLGTHDRALTVEVLGGGTEIGGSCVLVTAGDTRVLVDCGSRPNGNDPESLRPREYARALQGRIDAVVITHAHNDHAGWVPALLSERPGVPVYATAATCDLLGTMWFDSAKVLDRKGVRAYTPSDVYRALDALVETNLRHVVTIGDLTMELFAAGHIVGAASVVLSAGGQRVVVSGDVSGPGQETVGGFNPSASAQGADLLLLESTYAGDHRAHEPRGAVVDDFFTQIERVVDRGGIALVPAFALGRAQEVALLCAKRAPGVPVLIDGLARAVTEVYERHPGPDGQRRQIFSDQVRRVPQAGTAEAARRFRGGVVITTSGMLNQGPAVTWAKRVLPDPNSALMVVGYQDEESPGGKLLRLAENGGGRFMLPGERGGREEDVEVLAEVRRYQLGAHANADELAMMVTRMQAQQLMLVHGEPDGQARFALRMRRQAQQVAPTGTWTA